VLACHGDPECIHAALSRSAQALEAMGRSLADEPRRMGDYELPNAGRYRPRDPHDSRAPDSRNRSGPN
jgi:hypothetical protein